MAFTSFHGSEGQPSDVMHPFSFRSQPALCSPLLYPPLFAPYRVPDPGGFGRGERESGEESDGGVWQGRGEGRNSSGAVGEAVEAKADALILLWRPGSSVPSHD